MTPRHYLIIRCVLAGLIGYTMGEAGYRITTWPGACTTLLILLYAALSGLNYRAARQDAINLAVAHAMAAGIKIGQLYPGYIAEVIDGTLVIRKVKP